MLHKVNNTSVFFVLENDLIYRKKIDTNIALYVSQRICAFSAIFQNIFNIMHDVNKHSNFDRDYN